MRVAAPGIVGVNRKENQAVNPHPGSDASEHDAGDSDLSQIENAFAGLTAIDIIDGELVPRARRVRTS
ncbi:MULTISPECIES: hypothetical protein [unclassified Microbacterium]|uniref:hypothetical protein n=1 Tax=unclassified Microbacterium TaxID=2609290 RepID=UPI0037463A15